MTEFFGERVAATYDSDEGMFASDVVDTTADVLAELAGNGAALELAIGTGRIAVPLAERGITVAGIDSSAAMLARLREKTAAVRAVEGDMTTTRVDGEFGLVYLVFNTIFNLTTQDAQVACFENAAAHLRPGGRFLIETGVPPLQYLPPGQTVLPFQADPDHLGFDVFDVATQQFSSQHYHLRNGHVEATHVAFRYAWPAELDLMASIAGLTLENRYAGWRREPFTHLSASHVSVYLKASSSTA